MKKGDKIVCVDDVGAPPLTKDRIYTVKEVVDGTGINVYEAKPDVPFTAFWGHRFRKIEPRSFTNALTKSLAEEACKENIEVEEFELI